ncbi:hypothetical protein [Asaia spathodeae]|uniref:Uncharacterized protein n=2 Tax=Asaia spathodeae TaxID=657016 RepID=A0ABX2P3S9_9PROT
MMKKKKNPIKTFIGKFILLEAIVAAFISGTSEHFDFRITPIIILSPVLALTLLLLLRRFNILSMRVVSLDNLAYFVTLPLLLARVIGQLISRGNAWLLTALHPEDALQILQLGHEVDPSPTVKLLFFPLTGSIAWMAMSWRLNGTKRQVIFLPLLCLVVSALCLFIPLMGAFIVLSPHHR